MTKEKLYYEEDEYDVSEDNEVDEDERSLLLFKGHDKPTPKVAWDFYTQGIYFNDGIKLEDTVRVNENFYIGR